MGTYKDGSIKCEEILNPVSDYQLLIKKLTSRIKTIAVWKIVDRINSV
jgi:hypothetical protein